MGRTRGGHHHGREARGGEVSVEHLMSLEKEYELLARLEQETTRIRYTVFTALLSVSFLLPGLAIRTESSSVVIYGNAITISKLVFLMGFLFYCFTVFHYEWYHRYSHKYRGRLKALEMKLGILIYSKRKRLKLGPMKFHFNWTLYILGLAYATITWAYVGEHIFSVSVTVVVLLYCCFLATSIWRREEPHE